MSENSQHLPIGYKISGHYKILKVLGQGGFGIVYKVENLHRVKDNIFIIKELFLQKHSFRFRKKTTVGTNPSMKHIFAKIRADILREVDILSSIKNKNIVQEYGYFEENDTVYSIMEYIEGMDLGKYIQKHSFDEDETIDLLEQLIHGLKEIHSKNIIHRDIKPSNIMRTKKGLYKLIDFTNNKSYMDSEITITGITSQGYSSPELGQKKAIVGAFSDIYSIGMTLIKVLTLESPPEMSDRFKDDDFQKTIDELPVSRGFKEIIRKMTQRDSENRFQSLEGIERALSRLNVDIEEEYIHIETEMVSGFYKKKSKKEYDDMKIVVKSIGVIFLVVSVFFIVRLSFFIDNDLTKEFNETEQNLNEKNKKAIEEMLEALKRNVN